MYTAVQKFEVGKMFNNFLNSFVLTTATFEQNTVK